MAKTFQVERGEVWLLPPSVMDFVPAITWRILCCWEASPRSAASGAWSVRCTTYWRWLERPGVQWPSRREPANFSSRRDAKLRRRHWTVSCLPSALSAGYPDELLDREPAGVEQRQAYWSCLTAVYQTNSPLRYSAMKPPRRDESAW